MANLNYPEYDQGFGGYGRPAKPSQASGYARGTGGGAVSGAAMGTSILPGWGTAIGAVAGAGLGAFGSYQQGEQADGDYQRQMEQYLADQERQRLMEEERRRQQAQQDELAYGGYAQTMGDKRNQQYAGFARQIGR